MNVCSSWEDIIWGARKIGKTNGEDGLQRLKARYGRNSEGIKVRKVRGIRNGRGVAVLGGTGVGRGVPGDLCDCLIYIT
jgi:hypothetical protein